MISEATKALSKALTPFVGGVGKELSEYLADQIRFLRWKSAIRIVERAKEFCIGKRISPHTIPIKFIVPFMEAASLENVEGDPTVTDMWASLFAASVTRYQARHAVYVDILKKLSSADARFVKNLSVQMGTDYLYSDRDFDADLW